MSKNMFLKMGHKYLSESGVSLKSTAYNGYNDTGRDEQWNEERNIYGFDEREVWDLSDTFVYWAYERMKMFNDRNCIDCSCEYTIINNEKVTLQYGIELFISLCEKYFNNSNKFSKESLKMGDILYNQLLLVFQSIIGHLNY